MIQAINDIYSQSIDAKRFAVIDPETETILVSRKINERCPIAGIAKLLTALLIVERGDLDRTVVIRDEDLSCPDERVCLKPGNAYSRHQLLACLLIHDACDAALALARDHSGEVENFVRRMNEKARALGMTSSLFCDPHGVAGEGHYSTVLDVARLAMAAEANATILRVASQYEFEIDHNDGEKIRLNNTNVLLKTFSICDGIKTGYTDSAGFCFVASASLGERRRIVIALGNRVDRHLQDTHHLLAWGLGQPLAAQGRVTLQSLAGQEGALKGDVEVPFFYDADGSSCVNDSPCQTEQNPGGERRCGFEYFQTVYGAPCADWARENLPPTTSRTVLYPFGGGDILFPLAMFPQARDFILVGKELSNTPLFTGRKFLAKRALTGLKRWLNKVFPRGKEKNIQINRAIEDSKSPIVRKMMEHYFRSSFFVTTELRKNFKNHGIDGIRPLLMAQLAHVGYPIHAVDEIEHGEALRIVFGDRENPCRLFYFSQDLSDVCFDATTPLYGHLTQAESFITLIKSCSYLLPSPEFSRLSRLITDRGVLLVQDPTGIPYDTLRERKWDVALHGRFFGDIPVFGERPEHRVLRAAYHAKGLGEALPFGFGYLKNPAIASIVVAWPNE